MAEVVPLRADPKQVTAPAEAPAPTDYRAALDWARVEIGRFKGSALRIGSSPTVHAVRWREDQLGLTRAAPACHVGHSRPDGDSSIHPVRNRAVTCSLCLDRPIALAEGEPYVPASGQLSLHAAEDVPPLGSYPPSSAS